MSSCETPTIWQPGINPAFDRWKRPGNSLRRDRSPVAPTRTTTCACFGPTPGGTFANYKPRYDPTMCGAADEIKLYAIRNAHEASRKIARLELAISRECQLNLGSSVQVTRCWGGRSHRTVWFRDNCESGPLTQTDSEILTGLENLEFAVGCRRRYIRRLSLRK
jgi:hypothetical protein